MNGSKQAGQGGSGRFKPGRSGNPAGPAPGARHPAFDALDTIGHAGAAEVLATVIAAATGGDARSADIILRRCWPERKGRPVVFPLAAVKTAADVLTAMGSITTAVAGEVLSPEEGHAVASILGLQNRVIETVAIEELLAAVERAVKEKPR